MTRRASARPLTIAATASCLGLAALGAGLFVAADLASGAYATSTVVYTDGGSGYVSISADDITTSLTIGSSSVTASSLATVTLEASIGITANLYLSMADSTTALYVDGDTSSTPAITATSTIGTLDDLTNNTWGYSLDGTTYQAVPALGSAVQLTSDNVNSDNSTTTTTYDIYYGVKADASLASGTYANNITYTVIASGVATVEPTTLSDLTNMQEMTADICSASATGETAQLTDTRDGKTYWVAKLKDGNCWMTQNLDFDITTSTVLTTTDSNVSEEVNFGEISYDVNLYTDASQGSTDATAIQTWDLGQYVIINPGSFSFYYCISDVTTLAECPLFASIGNRSARTEITEDGTTYDNTTYDAHYLIGNYYSWNAATAGSGYDAVSSAGSAIAVAESSICPAGWQLPLSSDTYNETSGSFYNLYYGLSNLSNITSDPYYLVRGGAINTGNGLVTAGSIGAYWSSVLNLTDQQVYFMYFLLDSSPSNTYYGYYGANVRCVAIVDDSE